MAKKGDKIGPYELVEVLGEGGNGTVWVARGNSGDVAIKLLKPRASSGIRSGRFRREIQTLVRLKSVEGVLPILEWHDGDEAQASWFAMPIATPLRKGLEGPASLKVICTALAGIAEALARVHELGVSH